MIQLLQRLRNDEEGQVVVLGAIFGLVLMLCVLSTVNLGRAVYAKVQLQTAADAAAYSQAAVEARVLNFTAYTNRAMVVHYASIMAAAAYLAWVHFLWAAIDPVLSMVPKFLTVPGRLESTTPSYFWRPARSVGTCGGSTTVTSMFWERSAPANDCA